MLAKFTLVLMPLIVASCGGGGGSNSRAAVTPAGDVPAVSPSTGQLIFQVEDDIDPESVSGYVVGYTTQLSVEQAGDTFYIDNVPAGDHEVIITAGTLAINTGLNAEAPDRGIRLAKQTFLAGIRNDLNAIEIPLSGSLSGKVTLNEQSDHAGIDVYIPGTTYIAKTDSSGNYSFASIPVGTHNLYMEYQGFYRGQVENISVVSEKETKVGDVLLIPGTGVDGGILIEGGKSITNNLTVNVNVWAEGDKPTLMKISESENFSGTAWKPIQTTATYTFTSQGAKTLYVMFSDANGLESSPYSDSITVDLFSDETQLFKPTFNVASTTVYAPATSINLTGITVPSQATKMLVSQTGLLADAVETTPATTYAVPIAQTAASCGTKEILVAFKDESGFVSSVSDRKAVAYTCWGSMATFDAPSFTVSSPDVSLVAGNSYYIYLFQAGLFAAGRYDIATNTWHSVDYNSGIAALTNRSVVWTGDQTNPSGSDRAIAFGGTALVNSGTAFDTNNAAEIYDPGTDTWSTLTVASGSAPTERSSHAAVFCAGKMFIWGGETHNGDDWTADSYLNNGGVYTLSTQTWASTGTGGDGALSARAGAKAFCDAANQRVLVFGGYDGSSIKADGAYYNLSTGAWTHFTSDYPHPNARGSDGVHYANGILMVWGNLNSDNSDSNLGAYWNGTSWQTVTTSGAPTAKQGMGIGFNGEKLVVWSGNDGSNAASSEGKYYDMDSGSWSTLPTGGEASTSIQLMDWVNDRFIIASYQSSADMLFKQYFPFD